MLRRGLGGLLPPCNEGDPPWEITTDEAQERLAAFLADPDTSYMLLSRFKLKGNQLDYSTEQEIIRVPVDRGICCHVGGEIDFDGHGNLYLVDGRRHELGDVGWLHTDR